MIQVGYYFGMYDAGRGSADSPVPPELKKLGITTRHSAIELFRKRVGDGRSESTFQGSINGDIRYVSVAIRAGQDLRQDRIAAIGSSYGKGAGAVWRVVRKYMDLSHLNGAATNRHWDRNSIAPRVLMRDQDAASDIEFVPTDSDEREFIERQISYRRGQKQFREKLRMRYGGKCLVTGCEVFAVVEAAHIRSYLGPKDDNAQNGLLLRSDIHVLFDLDRIGIHPDTLEVELHPSLKDDPHYASLAGTTLRCGKGKRPSRTALQHRYERFQD
jgi:hypothetical protein